MAGLRELISRIKAHLKFSKQELGSLVAVLLVSTIIFSSCDWGPVPGSCSGEFDLQLGIQHFFISLLIIAFSIFFRLTCQKIYALKEGMKAEFKVWWVGLGIAFVVAMLSVSLAQKLIPLIFVGAIVVSFMVKQRLGEYRYGLSYFQNSVVGVWGVLGNLILALVFGIGLYLLPESYIFYQGMVFNLIMAWCSLVPLPQLDGLNIFFGSRVLYYIILFVVAFSTLLIITQTAFGLILLTVLSIIYLIVIFLISSNK